MNQVYKDNALRGGLANGNKTALYTGILDTCAGMRKKLDLLRSGKIKTAVSMFKDPRNHKKVVRITQTLQDGHLKTNFWMDDSAVWQYCAKKREEFDEFRKHASQDDTNRMFREYFMCSWLLEVYILMKYGIDLRHSEWADPTGEDFLKVNWIIDNDEFAKRYKLTTYSESRGISDPFNKIRVEVGNLPNTTVTDKTESGILLAH